MFVEIRSHPHTRSNIHFTTHLSPSSARHLSFHSFSSFSAPMVLVSDVTLRKVPKWCTVSNLKYLLHLLAHTLGYKQGSYTCSSVVIITSLHRSQRLFILRSHYANMQRLKPNPFKRLFVKPITSARFPCSTLQSHREASHTEAETSEPIPRRTLQLICYQCHRRR